MSPAVSSVESVDVLIVGSGFGGSVTAAKMASPDRKILVLEEGERFAGEQFTQSMNLDGFLRIYRGHGDLFDQTRHPRLILRNMLAGNGKRDIIIMRGKGVGGGSLVYSNVHLRAPSLVFDLKDGGGRRLWPESVRRGSLDPYYASVEEKLNVHQLGWHEVARRAQVLGEGLRRIGGKLDPIRLAVKDCVDCGFCTLGCRFDSKQSLYLNYIPEAEEKGAIFRPRALATEIAPLRDGGWSVAWRDLDAGRHRETHTKTLILSAGPIATPVLLLRSRRNLERLSRQVGKNLSLTADMGLGSVVPDQIVDSYKGRIITTICYSYLKDHHFVFEDLHYLPIASAVSFPVATEGAPRPRYVGPVNKRLMKNYGRHMLSVGVMGIDRNEGQVTLDFDGEARLHFEPSRHTEQLFSDAKEIFRELVKALGGTMLTDRFSENGGVATVHPLSTCRMADKPEEGVVDPTGAVFGYQDLFIVDGSILPTSVAVNPSHTIAAIAVKLAAGIEASLSGEATEPARA